MKEFNMTEIAVLTQQRDRNGLVVVEHGARGTAKTKTTYGRRLRNAAEKLCERGILKRVSMESHNESVYGSYHDWRVTVRKYEVLKDINTK